MRTVCNIWVGFNTINMNKKLIIALFLVIIGREIAYSWGFFAHQRINRLAVFTLPPEMVHFYKKHIIYITENAVNPDKRRYAVEGEAPRHYIDIDAKPYGADGLYTMPRKWEDAVAKYTEDTLQAYGIVPWHINVMYKRLVYAFRARDVKRILSLSADIGHYIGDGNVPLHTTENYNGQMTGQKGIHGFWESRIPELYSDDYDFFVGKAEYVADPLMRAWQGVTEAHLALDSVFRFEIELTKKFGEDRKYSFEDRAGKTTKVYSKEFSKAYQEMLDGQIERRMRASIKMVGDYWYSAWVDAGQPNLDDLAGYELTEEDLRQLEEEKKQWEEKRPQIAGGDDHDHHH